MIELTQVKYKEPEPTYQTTTNSNFRNRQVTDEDKIIHKEHLEKARSLFPIGTRVKRKNYGNNIGSIVDGYIEDVEKAFMYSTSYKPDPEVIVIETTYGSNHYNNHTDSYKSGVCLNDIEAI